MQFDRAESMTPSCAACRQPLAGQYYTLHGQTICEACRAAMAQEIAGASGAGRFAMAFFLGALAAAAGAGIYFAVLARWNIDFGLVAILVGYMVGATVRKCSQGRGGWAYQLLAVFLTYSAVAAAYTGYAIKEFPRTLEAIVYAYRLPFIIGFKSPISLFIIGFALFEAWRLNIRVELVFSGPHPLSSGPPDGNAAGA